MALTGEQKGNEKYVFMHLPSLQPPTQRT